MAALTEFSLHREVIRLDAAPPDKQAAIREAGALLVASGVVDPAYVGSMIGREAVADTYLGHGVAIPHGLGEDRHLIRRNGVAVLQVPRGVDWNVGQRVRLVVAIAASSDAHLGILGRLAGLTEDEALLARLARTTDPSALALAFTGRPMEAAAAVALSADLRERFEWALDYPAGLHTRPASAWVASARRLRSPVRVRAGERVADAGHIISLLQLGARRGETLTISSEGPDAADTLQRFRAAITSLSAAERRDAERADARARATTGWRPPEGAPGRRTVTGIPASSGLSIAPVHVLAERAIDVEDEPASFEEGGRRLQDAIAATRDQLAAIADDAGRRLGPAEAAIFAAQGSLLDDSDLVALACRLMVEGHGVAWSWHRAVERTAGALAENPNRTLAARAADLRDVGRRVLGAIDPSVVAAGAALPPGRVVLIARDLTPSDTVSLDPARIAGLAVAEGGPAAHTAILARTLGLPAVVGCGPSVLEAVSGTLAIIDGDGGRVHFEPSEAAIAAARVAIETEARRRDAEQAERALPAETTDGHRIVIGANINMPDQAAFAVGLGADCVGLMRTEFLFLGRARNPTEDEQEAIYAAMVDRLGADASGAARSLVVRALDIGGDKQVAHLGLPREENPFLGVRGARLLLRRPDLLEPQLRALYRAAKRRPARIRIMFPMVTSVGEVRRLREVCERVRSALDAPSVPIGIMVEIPAAAIASAEMARHVDFFSIGSNDLTQFTLAIDRQNPELAPEADSLHPAVLRLIRMTIDGARTHRRWTSACGGLAGNPFGATILAGLGVDKLSMTPREIPAVKARLRRASRAALATLAERALACDSAEAVRALDPEAGSSTASPDTADPA